MPSDKQRVISATLDSPMHKQTLYEYAAARGMRSIGDLVRMALWEYLRRHKPAESSDLRRRVDAMLRE